MRSTPPRSVVLVGATGAVGRNVLAETLRSPAFETVTTLGRRRVDVKHLWVDPVIVAGPWVLAGFVLSRLLRRRK